MKKKRENKSKRKKEIKGGKGCEDLKRIKTVLKKINMMMKKDVKRSGATLLNCRTLFLWLQIFDRKTAVIVRTTPFMYDYRLNG